MRTFIHSIALLTVLFLATFNSIAAHDDVKKYPFVMPANQAIEKISVLEKISGKKVGLHADEKKLLREAAAGKLQTFTFAEAGLIASGAVEPALRKKYLAQLDSIEEEARKALDGADSDAEKGKRLLKFLHAGAMSKGYSTEQTDLSVVLAEGRFNCVSSAVMYNVIARRLGLDVQAIEIPGGAYGTGHVFSVLKDDGRMIPVETTNARGFNINDSMKKKNKRPLSDLGLIAVIYYNRGVLLARENCYHEALLANLCALSLDGTNASAANNAMAEIVTWELDLAKQGKHTEALEVLRVGLTLAPGDAKLLQNRNALVHDIVMKEVKAGKYADALNKIDAHKSLLKDKKQVRNITLIVIDSQARSLTQKKEWQDAVNVYVEALKRLPGDAHLTNNLTATYASWARTHMDASDWAGAVRIYEQGLATLPGNGLFTNNIRYAREQMKR